MTSANPLSVLMAVSAGLCGAFDPPGDASSATSLLAERELKKSGLYYIVPAEKELADGLRTLEPLRRKADAAAKAKSEMNARILQAKNLLRQKVQMYLQLGQQIGAARSVTEHNALVQQRNALLVEIEANELQIADAEKTSAISDESASSDAYFKLLDELRSHVDQAAQRYAELANDAGVAKALELLSLGRTKPFRIGPSAKFKQGVKRLEIYEKKTGREEISLRPVGNNWLLDVTVNGRRQEMMLDTGAGSIAMPRSVADSLGLRDLDNYPTVKGKVADGREVEGKLVFLQSVRVGKHTIQEVECIILPGEGQALLGGSFLRHFVYTINPTAQRLVLRR